MGSDKIIIRGAREHNLKNIDLEIPRDKLVVITGLSGSGKSSLAFDTIYAEGQRRYVESLSAYARQFLEQMEKPDVDSIDGLSPAISIEQKTTSKNPRSTVATVTEIYDYLRVLFSRIGIAHCHKCGKEITAQSIDQIVDKILQLVEGAKLQILSPVVRGRKGEYKKLFHSLRRAGYGKVRVDGEIRDLVEDIEVDKNKKHNIEVIIDRIIIKDGIRKRLADSMETALRLADGIIMVEVVDGKNYIFSEKLACTECGISVPEITPRMFSFNNPYGACPECGGIGNRYELDPDLIIPDKKKSLNEGALKPWEGRDSIYFQHTLQLLADRYNFSLDTPFENLDEEIQRMILYGSKSVSGNDIDGEVRSGSFDGIIKVLERKYKEAYIEEVRYYIQRFMTFRTCPYCLGARLRPESLSIKIKGLSIYDIARMSTKSALKFFNEIQLSEKETVIAQRVLKEIRERLGFLLNVGLDYLTLDRAAATLSGGEGQRIRLATQIGSSLMGVLYILDEPSIGLHQRDNRRLLDTLVKLRDLGNTVLVVEHDEETIKSADYVIDLGPGAGELGGNVVAFGTPEEIIQNPDSITGKYLKRELKIPVPLVRRPSNGNYISILGAKENNLKNIDVKIPLGTFTCITGVSGSGKSTLLNEILYKALSKILYRAQEKPGLHHEIRGISNIDKAINIDQSPIGRTPRSNPATYTGVFTFIREVFSKTPEARARGYRPGRFSFNVKGGRCESCQGDGVVKIEMHFLPDVYVTCDVCKGKRYNRETLEVRYKGKNIADILEMTVNQALAFFENITPIRNRLKTLYDVGLDYIRLGQSATTLSGGEAQRVKLSAELSRRATGRTVYILDEPTTGLHFADIKKLLDVLNRLVDAGNTVIVIEHNLDVIKTADHIVDLGPEGGDDGGWIVAEGSPEMIAENDGSYTGQFLRKSLSI